MKRICQRALALFLILALLPVLPACSDTAGRLMWLEEEERAYALYDVLAQSLLEAHSIAVTSNSEVDARLGGERVRITYTELNLSRDQNGTGRTDHYETSYRVKYDGILHGTDFTYYDTAGGYADGYMYRSYNDNGIRTGGKTKVPHIKYAEEYFTMAESFILLPDTWECTEVSCTKEKDGSFTAVFRGVNDDGLGQLESYYGTDLSQLGTDIYLTDAEVEVRSTPELLFDSIRYTLTYTAYDEEGNPRSSTYDVVTEQTYAYEIPADFSGVDLNGYEDIGDLRVVEDFTYELENRVYADQGFYTYNSRYVTTEGDDTSVWVYDAEMDFYTSDGGIVYESKGRYGYEGEFGEIFHTRSEYEGGVFTYSERVDSTGESWSDSYEVTEEYLRGVMYSEVELGDFADCYVTEIQTLDAKAGRHRLILGGGLERIYREKFSAEYGQMDKFTAYVDVTFQEGELMSYAFYLLADGHTNDHPRYSYEMTVSCSFEERKNVAVPL